MPQRAPPSRHAPSARVLDRILRARALDNLRLVTIARTAVLAAIAGWLLARYDLEVMWENLVVLLLLAVLGVAQLLVRRRRPDALWPPLLFVTLDVIVFVVALLYPGNAYPEGWPWQMVLRQPSYLYLLLIVALATLSLQPLVTLWAGMTIALAWSVGMVLILSDPLTTTQLVPAGMTPSAQTWLDGYLAPTYVHVDDWAVRVFVTLVITAILTLAALRSRRLLEEQVEAARQRANLARYLDPAVVDQLAGRDQPLGQVRTQRLAVLFADMQGFTHVAEDLPPERVIELLRGFHGRLAEAVFRHGGSIDKFIGDAQMAVFGLPEAGPDDAARALACAEAIVATIDRWNAERRRDEPAIGVGIGLHLGDAVLGDIGGGDRFEFAVIGDAVNVAARLERLTRELQTPIILSGALADAIPDRALLANYRPLPAQALRGRHGTVDVWVRATETLTPARPSP